LNPIRHRHKSAPIDCRAGRADERPDTATWNRTDLKRDDGAIIDEIVARGRFVVMKELAVYCRQTDAVIGSRRVLLGDWSSRAEAEAFAREHYDLDPDSDRENQETSIQVLPLRRHR
jgi:hypothetical protein